MPATAPVRVRLKAAALVGRDGELGVHGQVARGIHGEHRKGVALVLVLRAEPLGMGHPDHAGHLLDLTEVRDGQELDDGVARGGQEALGVGAVGARTRRRW